MKNLNFLHFSDLHFDNNQEDKKKIFNDLLVSLRSDISNKLINPDYLVISGDILNRAKGKNHAVKSLNRLIEICGFDKKREKIIITPGNHDLDREHIYSVLKEKKCVKENSILSKINFFSKSKLRKGDKLKAISKKISLTASDFKRMHNAFENYNYVCSKLNIPPYFEFKQDSKSLSTHTFGYRVDHEKKVIFFIFNSSWFCVGNKHITGSDMGNLFLGNQLIKEIINSCNCVHDEFNYLKIAVIHHPYYWLDWSERYTLNSDESSTDLLLRHFDLILSGHEHGSAKSLTKIGDRTLLSVTGSAYDEMSDGYYFLNNFNEFKIYLPEKKYERNVFRLKPNSNASGSRVWVKSRDEVIRGEFSNPEYVKSDRLNELICKDEIISISNPKDIIDSFFKKIGLNGGYEETNENVFLYKFSEADSVYFFLIDIWSLNNLDLRNVIQLLENQKKVCVLPFDAKKYEKFPQIKTKNESKKIINNLKNKLRYSEYNSKRLLIIYEIINYFRLTKR